jgi:hypothetical protein
MSVRSSQRSIPKAKFQVAEAAKDLLDYSVCIINSKKVCRPRTPDRLKNRMRQITLSEYYDIKNYAERAYINIISANSVYKKNTIDMARRAKYIENAINSLIAIKALLNECANAYHIDLKKIQRWNSLATVAKDKAEAWQKSDRLDSRKRLDCHSID